MPLSANSPTGPFSLFGLDALTLEQLKERNRKEHLFTAKCCDARVQIRTPPNKVPHFYHLSTTPNCSGGGRESQAHLALKARIGAAAIEVGWDAETEAAFRNPDGALVWKADVLAVRGNVRIAFEVQLSNPDWSAMHERQLRYQAAGVRGLWFVKTSKPFPQKMGKAFCRAVRLSRRETQCLWILRCGCAALGPWPRFSRIVGIRRAAGSTGAAAGDYRVGLAASLDA